LPISAASVVIMIGTKAHEAGLDDRLARRFPVQTLGVEREVDHHDRRSS